MALSDTVLVTLIQAVVSIVGVVGTVITVIVQRRKITKENKQIENSVKELAANISGERPSGRFPVQTDEQVKRDVHKEDR